MIFKFKITLTSTKFSKFLTLKHLYKTVDNAPLSVNICFQNLTEKIVFFLFRLVLCFAFGPRCDKRLGKFELWQSFELTSLQTNSRLESVIFEGSGETPPASCSIKENNSLVGGSVTGRELVLCSSPDSSLDIQK